MAHAKITREWPDGEALVVVVSIDASYPDAVDEARMECRKLYAEALEITLAVPSDEDAGE